MDGAVKVEEQARGGGIAEVVCVEQVEDFDDGFQMAVAQWDGVGQARVPGEKRIVFAKGVALDNAAVGAYTVRDSTPRVGRGLARAGCGGGLCRIVAYAIVEEYIAGQSGQGPQIEAVALVAV